MPDVVMNDVVEVVSGQGLWYVDVTFVIQEDVSAQVVSKVMQRNLRKNGLPVQGVAYGKV